MIRISFTAIALVFGVSAALAQEAAQKSPPAKAPPMRFEWVREGPADTCGDRCRAWIAATGNISVDTPAAFSAFAQSRDVKGATVVLDSTGGSVLPALALGRLFRQFILTTTVGRTTKLPSGAEGNERATLSPRGICASMCVFALIGGARRSVPAEANVLVHQIWPSAQRNDAFATTYSAAEIVRVQREAGLMAKYTIDMGADIALFTTAMRIPPWERLRPLNAEEVRRMGLHDTDDPFSPPPATLAAGNPQAMILSADEAIILADRGWSVTGEGGSRAIGRKHPITVEGEQIGSFELSFSCGKTADLYAVTYTETRRLPEDKANDRLRGVLLASGKERSLLRVETPASEAANELRSVARGAASSAMVATLAEAEARSLVVVTQTASKMRTQIRLGNTGFAGGFSQALTECGK